MVKRYINSVNSFEDNPAVAQSMFIQSMACYKLALGTQKSNQILLKDRRR